MNVGQSNLILCLIVFLLCACLGIVKEAHVSMSVFSEATNTTKPKRLLPCHTMTAGMVYGSYTCTGSGVAVVASPPRDWAWLA